jgi:S-adenosylmethionine:tRNA ribosyltransferase-isomerase
MQIASELGHVPLPPYMKRQDSAQDRERYQTEFAKHVGSVAAPTASLNMTKQVLKSLQTKGVKICYLTLHVGLGTFLPIRTEKVEKHAMHSEWFEIPASTLETIRLAKHEGRRVVAVGTTVARSLEFVADKIAKADSSIQGEADIFIYPGYEFKVVNVLVTNFHAPKSTVLMLTAAFAGWPLLKQAYNHALDNDYRFLSYGDSMLIV